MMGVKYSAEWWERIAGLNREISAPGEPSSVIDDLIQATASAKPVPARKSETPSTGGYLPGGAIFVKSKRTVFVG
jgi:hypothetical protein